MNQNKLFCAARRPRVMPTGRFATWAAIAFTCWPLCGNAQQANLEAAPDSMDTEVREPLNDDLRALIRPHREAVISSLIAARVKTVHVRDGDRFKTGAPLVTFECNVLNASLQAARARLKQYGLTHAANRELRKDNAVSKLDLALSGAKVEEGEAEAALARAQLRKCKVTAPFDGKVVKVQVNEHESVEVGGNLLFILDDDQLDVTFHAPSDRVASITPGQQFRVAVDEMQTSYDAVVTAIIPRIDPTSRTIEITGRLQGQHRGLIAGMSGSVIFESLQ